MLSRQRIESAVLAVLLLSWSEHCLRCWQQLKQVKVVPQAYEAQSCLFPKFNYTSACIPACFCTSGNHIILMLPSDTLTDCVLLFTDLQNPKPQPQNNSVLT